MLTLGFSLHFIVTPARFQERSVQILAGGARAVSELSTDDRKESTEKNPIVGKVPAERSPETTVYPRKIAQLKRKLDVSWNKRP